MPRPHRTVLLLSILLGWPWEGAPGPGGGAAPEPAGCAEVVAVARGDRGEQVVCRDRVVAALEEAAQAIGCQRVPPLPRHQGGDRLTVRRGRGRRCVVSAGPLEGPALVALGLPLDLNRATAADLLSLPGIGPARARAIVADREARGPFLGPGDLVRVAGVGPGIVAGLAGRVVAGDLAVQGRITP